ncbi:MAG: hypothetical protein PHE29_05805 [Tissierellia bacterium]|nr:hypothetical protein [Tissierellia bacterium]MDD4781146.1 hypothetical protein [Tissierellia bacterium]
MKIRITEEELKSKEEKIKELRETNESYVSEMVKLYKAYLKELNTVIEFLKERNYYFEHPDLNEITTIGPILGKNKQKNILYAYDVKDGWVKEINMYQKDEEPKRMPLHKFFALYNFEDAMKGLLSLVDRQDKIISQFEEENNILMAQIKNYGKIIEENS